MAKVPEIDTETAKRDLRAAIKDYRASYEQYKAQNDPVAAQVPLNMAIEASRNLMRLKLETDGEAVRHM